MFCSQCGTEVSPGSAFCYSCGSKMVAAAGDTSAGPEAPPAPPSQAAPGVSPPSDWPQSLSSGPHTVPSGNGLSTAGIWCIVCSIVALLFLPPVFGGVAIYLAYRAKKAGDRAGDVLMIAAITATVVGMVIGAIVVSSMNS